MTTVKFSDHAILKLKMLQEHGVSMDLDLVKGTVYHPDKRVPGYGGRKIAQRRLDADHVLRVFMKCKEMTL